MSDQHEVFSGDEENDVKVCRGLTDEERREIRKSQRLLRKEIADLDVEEARARNNEIHKKVRYIRESVLDAENLDEIAKKATIKVDQMVQVSRSLRRRYSLFRPFGMFNRTFFSYTPAFEFNHLRWFV